MSTDPTRWIDVFKTVIATGGWYKLAIASAAGCYWVFARSGIIPDAQPWEIRSAAALTLLFGLLTIASIVTTLLNFFPIRKWILHWVNIRRMKHGFKEYIPVMTPKEREILAYLLAHNQKTFTADSDGGHAASLLSRGIVIVVAQPGQRLDGRRVPMTIPDPIWDVLQQHKAEFPYTPPENGEPETHPWRIPWMAR